VPSRLRIALAALAIVVIGLLAFFAYGGVGSPGSAKNHLTSWVDDTGLGQSLGTLAADNRKVNLVLTGHLGTTALHTVCAILSDDTATAMADLPSPDPELNERLAEAYQSEYRVANDCYDAGTNAALDSRAKRELTGGQALLNQAVALARSATHAELSTTTTTTPDSGGIFG